METVQSPWPKSDYDSMVAFYGEVGMNMTSLNTPYPVKPSWDTGKRYNRITVHEKVAESMHRAMTEILEVYGREAISRLNLDNWGGCLSVRAKRGGTKMSTHAWGAANDWWPVANELRTPFKHAAFSKPEYRAFFNAWIREGWNPYALSLGRDSMHIEACDNGGLQLLPTYA